MSITSDNASNNDTMIAHLGEILEDFPGASNQTRCFDHITNLVAHSTLRPFDVAKAKADGVLDEAEQELQDLMQDLEDIGVAPDLEGMEDADGEDENDDDVDGWVDERESLTETERVALDASVRPVKLILLKV